VVINQETIVRDETHSLSSELVHSVNFIRPHRPQPYDAKPEMHSGERSEGGHLG
jgi:hypothetical protein